jgi:PST family polysaccharide transporter
MLVLVRLLSPADYGNMALAQSIIALLAVASFATLSGHARQLRDPEMVDWEAHFSAGAVVNGVLFCATLSLAWALSFTKHYRTAAWPLAALAVIFPIEIFGTLRHRMLEVKHEWKRYRVLLMIGTYLGLGSGLAVALMGGGVWALVVQPPMLGLPAVVDLFWNGRWRPRWSWSWDRYRETAIFGVNRMGSTAVIRIRQAVQQTVLAGVYDVGVLGIFSRSVGLATVTAGRIGAVAIDSLYTVVTRAEEGSPQFRRYAALVLRAVTWATVAAAVLLAVDAVDLVSLLYGTKWHAVAPLLPLAVAGVALSGVGNAAGSLLLANNALRTCLIVDTASAAAAVGLAFVLVPRGVLVYMAGLSIHGLAVLAVTAGMLWWKGGVSGGGLQSAFLPAIVAAVAGAVSVIAIRTELGTPGIAWLRVALDTTVYSLVYLIIIRVVFATSLCELIEVAPFREWFARLLFI